MTVGQYSDHHYSGYDDPTGTPSPMNGPRREYDLVNEVEAEARLYPTLMNHTATAVVATAVVADITLEPTGENNNIDVEAVRPGAAGNSITVTVVDLGAGETDHALPVVEVDGTDITVTLAEDGSSNLSTAGEVITAIEASAAASALVSVANADGHDGTGAMVAVAETALTGGVDASPTTDLPTILVDEDDSVWFSPGAVQPWTLSAWTQLVDNSA